MVDETLKTLTSPHSVDLHVGTQVRKRRKELGYSQINLAKAVGLTFQQIQKYERGSNRISASKLHEIGSYLKVQIPYFFEGLPVGDPEVIPAAETSADKFLKTADGQALAAAFTSLSRCKRRGIMSLVRSIVADDEEPV